MSEQEECKLRVSLLQTDIRWEDKAYNLENLKTYLESLSGHTDIVILPEMFSTGFSMRSHNLAEDNNGPTISTLKEWAKEYNIAICGSYIAVQNNNYYNRGFFISSDESCYYNKRHLFRMGNESKSFSAGENHCIFHYKGFNICLLVCYDLRFPVWARNTHNKYDLLLYVANWPQSRIKVWDTLVEARALENQAYVCGVNRVGKDGMEINYNGHSTLVDFKGNKLLHMTDPQENVETIEISKLDLVNFRIKFPVWKDADQFKLL